MSNSSSPPPSSSSSSSSSSPTPPIPLSPQAIHQLKFKIQKLYTLRSQHLNHPHDAYDKTNTSHVDDDDISSPSQVHIHTRTGSLLSNIEFNSGPLPYDYNGYQGNLNLGRYYGQVYTGYGDNIYNPNAYLHDRYNPAEDQIHDDACSIDQVNPMNIQYGYDIMNPNGSYSYKMADHGAVEPASLRQSVVRYIHQHTLLYQKDKDKYDQWMRQENQERMQLEQKEKGGCYNQQIHDMEQQVQSDQILSNSSVCTSSLTLDHSINSHLTTPSVSFNMASTSSPPTSPSSPTTSSTHSSNSDLSASNPYVDTSQDNEKKCNDQASLALSTPPLLTSNIDEIISKPPPPLPTHSNSSLFLIHDDLMYLNEDISSSTASSALSSIESTSWDMIYPLLKSDFQHDHHHNNKNIQYLPLYCNLTIASTLLFNTELYALLSTESSIYTLLLQSVYTSQSDTYDDDDICITLEDLHNMRIYFNIQPLWLIEGLHEILMHSNQSFFQPIQCIYSLLGGDIGYCDHTSHDLSNTPHGISIITCPSIHWKYTIQPLIDQIHLDPKRIRTIPSIQSVQSHNPHHPTQRHTISPYTILYIHPLNLKQMQDFFIQSDIIQKNEDVEEDFPQPNPPPNFTPDMYFHLITRRIPSLQAHLRHIYLLSQFKHYVMPQLIQQFASCGVNEVDLVKSLEEENKWKDPPAPDALYVPLRPPPPPPIPLHITLGYYLEMYIRGRIVSKFTEMKAKMPNIFNSPFPAQGALHAPQHHQIIRDPHAYRMFEENSVHPPPNDEEDEDNETLIQLCFSFCEEMTFYLLSQGRTTQLSTKQQQIYPSRQDPSSINNSTPTFDIASDEINAFLSQYPHINSNLGLILKCIPVVKINRTTQTKYKFENPLLLEYFLARRSIQMPVLEECLSVQLFTQNQRQIMLFAQHIQDGCGMKMVIRKASKVKRSVAMQEEKEEKKGEKKKAGEDGPDNDHNVQVTQLTLAYTRLVLRTALSSPTVRCIVESPTNYHGLTLIASNAMSVLNYASLKGMIPFQFDDIQDWRNIKAPYANLNRIKLIGCNFDGADLSYATMYHAYIKNTSMRNANLSYAKLKLSYNITGNTSHVACIAYNPAHGHLVSGCHDGSIRAWNDDSNTCLQSTPYPICMVQRRNMNKKMSDDVSHLSDPAAIAEIPEFMYASLYTRGCIRFMDTLTGERVKGMEINGIPHKIESAKMSSDLTLFAYTTSCNAKGWVYVWDIKRNRCVYSLKHEIYAHIIYGFSLDNKYLCFDHDDKKMQLKKKNNQDVNDDYDDNARDEEKKDLPLVSYRSVHASPTKVSSSTALDLIVWNLHTQHEVILHGHTERITTACFHPIQTTILASGSQDATIRIWNVDTGNCIAILNDHTKHINFVRFSYNGAHLGSASNDCFVKVWDVTSMITTLNSTSIDIPTCLATYEINNWTMRCLEFTPDGTSLIMSNELGSVHIASLKNGTFDGKSQYLFWNNTNFDDILSNHDGSQLMLLGHDGLIKVYNVTNRAFISTTHASNVPSMVYSVCFSSHGSVFSASTYSGFTHIYDYATWTKVKTIETKLWGLNRRFTMSPDGKYLAAIEQDKGVALYCLTTFEKRMVLKDNSDAKNDLSSFSLSVSCICFNPNSSILASGYQGGHLKLWNVHTGQCLATNNASVSRIAVMQFHPFRSHVLVMGTLHGEIMVWDTDDMIMNARMSRQDHADDVHITEDNVGAVDSVHQSQDQKQVDSQSLIKKFRVAISDVAALCFNKTGQLLYTMSIDKALRVWDMETYLNIRTIETNGAIKMCDLNPTGNRLATCDGFGKMNVHDIQTIPDYVHIQGHTDEIKQVCFSAQPCLIIATTSRDRNLHCWNIHDSTRKLIKVGNWVIVSLCYNLHTQRIAIATAELGIKLWDARTFELVGTMQGRTHNRSIHAMSFSGDGRYLASCSQDRTLKIWDTTMLECIKKLDFGESLEFGVVSLSYNGSVVAYGSGTSLLLWNKTRDLNIAMLDQQHEKEITCLSFTPYCESKLIASGSLDHTVKVWHLDTLKSIATLVGHKGKITSVCFSPSHLQIVVASASMDQTIKVWDVNSSTCIASLEGHTEGVTSICFSPDGTKLLSGSKDKTICLWSTRSMQLLRIFGSHGMQVEMDAQGSKLHVSFMDVLKQRRARFLSPQEKEFDLQFPSLSLPTEMYSSASSLLGESTQIEATSSTSTSTKPMKRSKSRLCAIA